MPGWGGCDVCEAEFETFSETLARLLAEDLATNLPAGPVVRVAIRWTGPDEPLALRVDVLGAHDQAASDTISWSPSDWAVIQRESERTDRLTGHQELQQASEALSSKAAEASGSVAARWGPTPMVVETARRLPAAFSAASVPIAHDFGVRLIHEDDSGLLEIRRRLTLATSRFGEAS